MNFVICEDHLEEAIWLRKKIESWAARQPVLATVSVYGSAEQFWFAYEENMNMDALILDIEMPGENGLSVARRLRERQDPVPVIFVTGMSEYMSEGYDVSAVHYLLKPVREDKLEECLNRILRLRQREEPFILLHMEKDIVKLFQKDIVMVEVFSHQCVYTTDTKTYTVSASLKEERAKLRQEWFVPAHRSVLVNLLHVTSITGSKVYLTGGREAVVSRRMYAELNQAFIRFYRARLEEN